MSKPEQAESGIHKRPSRYHQHLKREGRRYMRRAGKQKLDDAPRKLPRRGYET